MRTLEETRLTFRGEGPFGDGAELDIHYDNRGEPYRRGITLSFDSQRTNAHVSLFIEQAEAELIRNLIDKLFPRRK